MKLWLVTCGNRVYIVKASSRDKAISGFKIKTNMHDIDYCSTLEEVRRFAINGKGEFLEFSNRR